jgi:hypothetical protein
LRCGANISLRRMCRAQALRLIRHICTVKGVSLFQRAMQRHSGVVRCAQLLSNIAYGLDTAAPESLGRAAGRSAPHFSCDREHVSFKGEADPFKGDIPNQRVRDAAKEASEAIFNTAMQQPVSSLGVRGQHLIRLP